VLSQLVLPALLFLPGVSAIRTVDRVAAYSIGLLIWGLVAWRGRPAVGVRSFPARPWLLFCCGWLVLMLAHPNNYSLKTALGQVMLYIAVLSPAFWGGSVVRSPRQIGRLMALLFLCSALSASLGVAQAYRPKIFNPPVIPAMSGRFQGQDLMIEMADGRKVLRPCGLSDTPGAAATAGATAALIGLCWALRPLQWWKRLACLALAFIGVAAIYYTYVRFTMVMLVICLAALAGMFTIQGKVRSAANLVGGGLGLLLGAMAWVSRSAGSKVFERFATLLTTDPGKLYYRNRGFYVWDAVYNVLPANPLGYGLGWWGMIQSQFGDPNRISPIWVEVMISAWIHDGGLPLLVGYGGAVVVAIVDSGRIALSSRDRELAFWAAVIMAQNLSVVATCFSYVTFLSALGPQFWLLSAALHAADRQTRQAEERPATGSSQGRHGLMRRGGKGGGGR
jgi:hypothetical protein